MATIDSLSHIYAKQRDWAAGQQIRVVDRSSRNLSGPLLYTELVDDNLFQPLGLSATDDFVGGQGDELAQKLRALHSSSAIAVNAFHYWQQSDEIGTLARIMSWPANAKGLRFEYKFDKPPDIPGYRPNVDVAILYPDGSEIPFIGIESKFVEPYRDRPSTLKSAYLLSTVWDRFEMPALRSLARLLEQSANDTKRPFKHLNAAQLLRHLVAMCHHADGKNFQLGYFWYDVAQEEGNVHRAEIDQFKSIAADDGISFFTCSYQEFLVRVVSQCSSKQDYVKYLTNRYS